jgi:hypothetical protein
VTDGAVVVRFERNVCAIKDAKHSSHCSSKHNGFFIEQIVDRKNQWAAVVHKTHAPDKRAVAE